MVVKKIIQLVIEVVNGSLDKKLSLRNKLIYGFGGITIAIGMQLFLAWRLMPNKVLLNFLIFPFQIIEIYSLLYLIQGVTKYPFGKDSFWHFENEKYVPFLIRARGFLYIPYFVLFFLRFYLAEYMDFKTEHPHFYYWLIYNSITLILVLLTVNWIKIFLEKFETAVVSMRYILSDEIEFKNFERNLRNKIFSNKEIAFIITPILLIKLNEVLFAEGTWKAGGGTGYDYPLTAIYFSFSFFLLSLVIFPICSSIAHIYSKILLPLTILKEKKQNFLFYADGCAGLGKFIDLIYFSITKTLIIISILTFSIFLASFFSLQTDDTEFWKYRMIAITIFVDISVLIIFFYPLIQIKNIIRNKKEEERSLLLERIKQKEEIYLKRNLRNDEFEEIEQTFKLIERIDDIPEWGIRKGQWISLTGKVLLTLNGVAFQIISKYINI